MDGVGFPGVYNKALPSSSDCFSSFVNVGQMCEEYAARYGSECEFEGRLGHIVDGKFDPGLSEAMFERCLALCRESSKWKNESKVEYEDAYYRAEDRMCRTRSMPTNGTLQTETSSKKNKKNWTFATQITPRDADESTCIRLSLAHEQRIAPVESAVTTDMYKIVQQTSFVYTPTDYTTPILRLDARRTWSAHSRSSAEVLQRSVSGKCSIEIEVINSLYFKHRFTASYPALSIAVKLIDFIRNQTDNDPISPFSVQLLTTNQ